MKYAEGVDWAVELVMNQVRADHPDFSTAAVSLESMRAIAGKGVYAGTYEDARAAAGVEQDLAQARELVKTRMPWVHTKR